LSGLEAQVYLACDAAQTLPSLGRLYAGTGGEGEIRAALDRLQNDKLMVQMDDQFLSLAVFRNRPAQSPKEKSYVYQQLQEAAPAQSLLRAS